MDKPRANLCFQLVSRCYEWVSLVVRSNKAFNQWGEVFGDEVIAGAILDRLLHHSHIIAVQGESYRLRDKRAKGVDSESRLPDNQPVANSQGGGLGFSGTKGSILNMTMRLTQQTTRWPQHRPSLVRRTRGSTGMHGEAVTASLSNDTGPHVIGTLWSCGTCVMSKPHNHNSQWHTTTESVHRLDSRHSWPDTRSDRRRQSWLHLWPDKRRHKRPDR